MGRKLRRAFYYYLTVSGSDEEDMLKTWPLLHTEESFHKPIREDDMPLQPHRVPTRSTCTHHRRAVYYATYLLNNDLI